MKLFFLLLGLPGASFFAAAVVDRFSQSEPLPGLGTLLVPFLVIIFLVLLNGLFVMAEFAIIGVRPSRVEQLANEGNRVAESVLSVLQSPEKQNQYIATAQLGITVASLGLGMYSEPQIAHFIEPYLARLLDTEPHTALVETTGYVIALSLLTYLHVVIGEMVPKSVALSMAEKTVLFISPVMRLMQFLLALPVHLLNGIGLMLLRLFRVPPATEHARLHSPEELELIVEESAKSGLLNAEEEEMILNIFTFADRQVNQVMTPRRKIQAIPHNISLPELLQRVTQSRNSRFPVYEEDLDHIVGVLHIKDLVRQQLRMKGSFDIRLLLRSVPVVPEHYPVEKLLALFRRQHIHMAVVLDEFGGTAGIVTLEDLVEEVVGEVRDEFDQESEPLIEVEPGVLEVSGSYLIEDLEDWVYLGPEENLPDVETVGGFIMTELGRPPQVGDRFTYEDVNFTVLSIDGLAVGRARVEYPVSQETTGGEAPPPA